MRIICLLLTFLFTLLSTPVSHAAGDACSNISLGQGLPSATVRSLTQDATGFIWLGTDAGLCRYDGIGIQQINIAQCGTDQFVSTVLAHGNLIYAGTARSAFVYNQLTGCVSRVSARINSMVTSFTVDRLGRLWISTSSQGVFCVSGGSTRQYNLPQTGNNISRVYADADNQLWLYTKGTRNNLLKLNQATNRFEYASRQPVYGGMDLTRTADGTLWLGTWDHGLMQLRPDGTLTPDAATSTLLYHIHCVAADYGSQLLVGCDNGVFAYNTQTHTCLPIGDVSQLQSIADRFVYTVKRDREGGLWTGSFYGGVSYFSPIGHRFNLFSNNNGLNGNVVGRFCEDASHNIWIATDDGGLNCYNLATASFRNYPGQQLLRHYNVHALCADGNTLWTGTYSRGIIRLNTATGAIKQYVLGASANRQSCYALYKDARGRVWATSMDGVAVYDAQADNFRFLKNFGATTMDIKADRQGNLWFATQGKGLWRLGSNGRFTNYLHHTGAGALPSNEVNSIFVTPGGKLLFATSNGLCQWQGNGFAAIRLPLQRQSIYSIVGYGNDIWLTSAAGIIKYQPGKGIQIFNTADGVADGQFQINSGLLASDGSVFFGSTQGFNVFRPYNIRVNQVRPTVVISQIKLFNKVLSAASDKFRSNSHGTVELRLSHSENMITLQYAALSYCTPGKNLYAYRMDGIDNAWNYVGNQHEATYSNLAPGTYTFRVKATNNDGVWSSKCAELKIVILPPFWWSWPAQLLYVALIVAGIWMVLRWRLRLAERRHQHELHKLQEQNERATKDARLRFFTMIAHEIRTPVSLIKAPLDELKLSLRPIMQRVTSVEQVSGVSRNLQLISRNTDRLLELVNQLLDFNKVQQQGLELHFGLYNLDDILQSVVTRFKTTMESRNINFTLTEPDKQLTAMVDRESITKIVSNLLTNAMKYTHDSITLECRLCNDNDHFCITVADNGIGISEADQKKIFNEFYQARDNKPGTGIGLSIVQQLTRLHHGMVEVQSAPGKGSTFTVTLPLRQQTALQQDDKKPAVPGPDKAIHVATAEPAGTMNEIAALDKGDNTVLIVEDDRDLCNFLKQNFSKTYHVLTAGNGREALAQLRKHSVTLIVSDWMMPGMDGAELCRQVRGNTATSHIPFIMLTAKTDDEAKVTGIESGADAFIEKPFSMRYLEACIERLIEVRRELMHQVAEKPEKPVSTLAKTEKDKMLLDKMSKLIEQNLCSSDLNIQFLMKKLEISRTGLFAKTKALTGMAPQELITFMRLRKAAAMLREGNMRISQVCYAVGYSSPGYFARNFARQYGCMPSEYIKKFSGEQHEN